MKLMSYYPLPNRAPDNITGANNFRANYVASANANFYMAKVDHSLSDKDKLTGRYFYNGGPTPELERVREPGRGPEERGGQSTALRLRKLDAYHQREHRQRSPVYLHPSLLPRDQRRAGRRLSLEDRPQGRARQRVPAVHAAGFTALGTNAQERQQYPIEQQQVVDNITKIVGSHTLKFGVEARRSRNHEFNLQTVSGAFGFSTLPTGLPGNAATGSGLASLLVGFPTSFSQLQTQELDRTSWYLAGFAQDDWRMNNSLTSERRLALGDRHADGGQAESHEQFRSPIRSTRCPARRAWSNSWVSTAIAHTPYDGDWNNFGPRFGFAWKILGRERTGGPRRLRIFFAHPFDAGVPNAVALGFSISRDLNSPDNGITAPFYLRNGVPAAAPTTPKLDDSFGAVPAGANPNTAVSFFEQNRRTGYSQQFNLGVQRQLGGSSVIEVTVPREPVAKAGEHAAVDQSDSALDSWTAAPVPARSSFPAVHQRHHTITNARAVKLLRSMARFQKRYSKGLVVGANYTWSRFFDNTNEVGAT